MCEAQVPGAECWLSGACNCESQSDRMFVAVAHRLTHSLTHSLFQWLIPHSSFLISYSTLLTSHSFFVDKLLCLRHMSWLDYTVPAGAGHHDCEYCRKRVVDNTDDVAWTICDACIEFIDHPHPGHNERRTIIQQRTAAQDSKRPLTPCPLVECSGGHVGFYKLRLDDGTCDNYCDDEAWDRRFNRGEVGDICECCSFEWCTSQVCRDTLASKTEEKESE